MPRFVLWFGLLGGLICNIGLQGRAIGADAAKTGGAAKSQKSAPANRKDSGDKPAAPLVVVNIASVDRLLGDVDFVFNTAGRKDMSTVVQGLLGTVGDLKGLDRGKPFGVMVFLAPGFPPAPEAVAYLPVKDIDDLLKTVNIGPVATRKVEGQENRYELIGPSRTLQIRLANGYAFVGNNAEIVNRQFQDPAKFAQQLTARYDIAARADLKTVPEGMRTLFVTFLRTSAQQQMQQRDGERDTVYRARRARAESDLEVIEAILTHGEDLTIGLDTSAKNKNIVVEVALNATPDSPLSKMIKDVSGKRSFFGPVLNDGAPLSISASWLISESARKAFVAGLKAAEQDLAAQADGKTGTEKPAESTTKVEGAKDQAVADKEIKPTNDKAAPAEEKKEGVTPPRRGRRNRNRFAARRPRPATLSDRVLDPAHPAVRFLRPLIATAEKGHIDFFVQFVGTESNKMSLIGGARIVDGADMANALSELLAKFQGNSQLAELQLNVDSYRGVTFHRMQGKEISNGDRQLYGEKPGLYVGTGANVVWFAVGGSEAIPSLKKAMDAVAERDQVPQSRTEAPFRLVANVQAWLKLQNPNQNPAAEGRPTNVAALARTAFSKGGDSIKLDVRPTEQGIRLRIELQEGFIRMMGLGVSRQWDRSQGQRQENE